MAPRLSLKLPQPVPSDAPATATPTGRPKIKLNASQPPTPAEEPGMKKKRPAEAIASPAAKRIASDGRRASVVLKLPSARTPDTPVSAGPRIKLQKRLSSGPKLKRLSVKGRVPDRVPGNAYDSEDSERELDPATEQHLVLRMQPGEDCEILRQAIVERTIGMTAQEGGLDVAFKFLDRELRRALIVIRKNMYAAILVDLPCIVETMKSWDKRGWWKVSDISQMLLVLGRVSKEEEAKTYPLPGRALDEKSMAYAHGLTPPMHWVRKRRFRKRMSYKDTANVEDEVNKLLEEDERVEREGGSTDFQIVNRESMERSMEPESVQYNDDAVDTIEGYDDEAEGEEVEEMEEMDLDAAEADLQALFDQDAAEAAALVAETPTQEAEETAGTPTADDLFGDESSDEDDDDDDVDAYDEDAQARAAEQNLQREEIQDLENEIKLQRAKLDATKNQLLLQRQREKLKSLEEDLRMKRRAYGYDEEDED